MNNHQKVIGRKFLGELDNKLTDEEMKALSPNLSSDPVKAEKQIREALRTKSNFNKAHLKAYLAGHEKFHFGYVNIPLGDSGETIRIHAFHNVQQEYIYKED